MFRGFHKIKCPCGYEGLVFLYGDKKHCPQCEDEIGNGEKHHEQIKILPKEMWTIDEIIDAWEGTLEDANYHSFTSVPSEILKILKIHISNEEMLRKILLEMYEKNILEI